MSEKNILHFTLLLLMGIMMTTKTTTATPWDTPSSSSEETETAPTIVSTTTTATPPTTTTTTTTTALTLPTETTERVLTAHELRSMALLQETNATLEATQLHLYKQKTQLSLKFLNETLPIMDSIRKNMSDLLTSANDPSSSHSLGTFKREDDLLENELAQVDQSMAKNRQLLQKYSAAYQSVERQLQVVQQTLTRILLPHLVQNITTTPDDTETDPSDTSVLSGNGQITTRPRVIPSSANVLQDCGGASKSDSGSIIYKLDQNLNPHEACVWLISSEKNNASAIRLTLVAKRFAQNYRTYLSVGYFKDYLYDQPASFIWTRFEPSSALTLEIPSPVAFVHFVGSPSVGSRVVPSNGFRLNFQALYSRQFETLANYRNIFLTGPSGTRKYPLFGTYSSYERTVIVVQPTMPNSNLVINWWDFENDGDYDSLSVYTFEPNFTWERQNKLFTKRRDSFPLTVNFASPRNDPILLIFKTDGSGNFDGFDFSWGV